MFCWSSRRKRKKSKAEAPLPPLVQGLDSKIGCPTECQPTEERSVKIIRKLQKVFGLWKNAEGVWVQSPHNASGYYTIYGDDSSYQDHFNARLVTGNTGEVYARTGYLGFLRRTEAIGSDGGKIFVSKKMSHNLHANAIPTM